MKELDNNHQPKPFYATRALRDSLDSKYQQIINKFNTYFPKEYVHAAHGDWRENSPKDTLDNEWSLATAEHNRLRDILGRVVIVDDLEIPTDVVAPGLTVSVEALDGHVDETTLLSITDAEKGYLSIDSPLGSAILGQPVDTYIPVWVGKRVDYVRVIKIKKYDPTKAIIEANQEGLSLAETSTTKEVAQHNSQETETDVIVPTPDPTPSQKEVSIKPELERKINTQPNAPEPRKMRSIFDEIIAPVKPAKTANQPTGSVAPSGDQLYRRIVNQLNQRHIPVSNRKSVTPSDRGGREIVETIEFKLNGQDIRVVKTDRPKINYSPNNARQSSSAGDRVVSTKAYRLQNGQWVEFSYKL